MGLEVVRVAFGAKNLLRAQYPNPDVQLYFEDEKASLADSKNTSKTKRHASTSKIFPEDEKAAFDIKQHVPKATKAM